MTLLLMWSALALASGDDPAEVSPPAEPALASDASSLVQRKYAMRQVFTSQMKNPNPFSNKEWAETHTYTYSVVDWQQFGTKVEYRERVCGVTTEKVFGASAIYRDAFIRGVPVRALSASLSGTGPGATFEAGPYPQQFGVRLTDPFNEPLPAGPEDPRIVDDDKDGKPGVTVVIHHPMTGKGEVYVAQRSVVRLQGEVRADGVIVGNIRTAPDMVKLDADSWWLKTDSPQRPHPDPAMSPFALLHDGGDLDCASLLRRTKELFAAVPISW